MEIQAAVFRKVLGHEARPPRRHQRSLPRDESRRGRPHGADFRLGAYRLSLAPCTRPAARNDGGRISRTRTPRWTCNMPAS
jgi:hypothetical protein